MGKAKSRRTRHHLGNPHHHSHKPWILKKIQPILNKLRAPDAPSLRSLCRDTDIPFETLRRWQLKLRERPGWTPKEMCWGLHRRIFTDDEEEEIARQIRQHDIATHRLFTSEDFQTLITHDYLLKFQNSESVPDFVCSSTFVRAFMVRNRFSHRRQHFR
jgi:hypothetical protein